MLSKFSQSRKKTMRGKSRNFVKLTKIRLDKSRLRKKLIKKD